MYPTRPTAIICEFVRISACHEWYWRKFSYRRGLNDSGCLDDLLLVQLGTGTVKVAHDGGHAGLVTEHGGKVDRLLGVILGEAVQEYVSACYGMFVSSPSSIFFLRSRAPLWFPGLCDRTSSPCPGDGWRASWAGKPANRGGALRTSCATSLLWVSRGGMDVVKS
jgi:hypothetical protein